MKPTVKNCPMMPDEQPTEAVVVLHDKLLVAQTRMIHRMIHEKEALPEPWEGFAAALATYGLFHFTELNHRHRAIGVLDEAQEWEFTAYHLQLQADWLDLRERRMRKNIPYPPWVGKDAVHLSHREWLLFKNPRHYGDVWPDMWEPQQAPDVRWT